MKSDHVHISDSQMIVNPKAFFGIRVDTNKLFSGNELDREKKRISESLTDTERVHFFKFRNTHFYVVEQFSVSVNVFDVGPDDCIFSKIYCIRSGDLVSNGNLYKFGFVDRRNNIITMIWGGCWVAEGRDQALYLFKIAKQTYKDSDIVLFSFKN